MAWLQSLFLKSVNNNCSIGRWFFVQFYLSFEVAFIRFAVGVAAVLIFENINTIIYYPKIMIVGLIYQFNGFWLEVNTHEVYWTTQRFTDFTTLYRAHEKIPSTLIFVTKTIFYWSIEECKSHSTFNSVENVLDAAIVWLQYVCNSFEIKKWTCTSKFERPLNLTFFQFYSKKSRHMHNHAIGWFYEILCRAIIFHTRNPYSKNQK